ncbi:MAG: hypothetical protein R3F13_19515 [Prosthecobacter sp.]
MDELRPSRRPGYTEATLLSTMEGAGKLAEDEELAEAMSERGLGDGRAIARSDHRRMISTGHIERVQRHACDGEGTGAD